MSHLVIHAGQHKTGTTSVQHRLARNRATLARHGVIYPPTPGTAGHHVMAGTGSGLPQICFEAGGRDELWQSLLDRHANSDDVVLLSSEDFSISLRDGSDERTSLGGFVKKFDRVTVVLVLRQPFEYIQSTFIMKSAAARALTCAGFFKGAFSPTSSIFYGPELLSEQKRMLPGAELVCASYEPLAAQPDGVLDFVLSATKSELSSKDLPEGKQDWHNRSGLPLPTYMAHCIADSPHLVDDALIDFAQEALEAHYGRFSGTTCYTRAELANYAPALQKWRDELRAELGPDTLVAPFKMPDYEDFLHREDLTPGAWVEVCRVLNRVRQLQ